MSTTFRKARSGRARSVATSGSRRYRAFHRRLSIWAMVPLSRAYGRRFGVGQNSAREGDQAQDLATLQFVHAIALSVGVAWGRLQTIAQSKLPTDSPPVAAFEVFYQLLVPHGSAPSPSTISATILLRHLAGRSRSDE
jgi:hypothetical protein